MAKVRSGFNAFMNTEWQSVDIRGTVYEDSTYKTRCIVFIDGGNSDNSVSLTLSASEMAELGEVMLEMGRMFEKFSRQR